jgi:hypothetical protein
VIRLLAQLRTEREERRAAQLRLAHAEARLAGLHMHLVVA